MGREEAKGRRDKGEKGEKEGRGRREEGVKLHHKKDK